MKPKVNRAAYDKTALIVGATGIVGHSLAEHLIAQGWRTFGLARRPSVEIEGLIPITADLLDPGALRQALAAVRPTHVFFATWARHDTEAENIRVNGAMMRNLLNVLRPKKSLEHFALVTGLKHYIGPFEMYAQVPPPPTPFLETIPRLDIPNFYYTLEDEVFAAAAAEGFTWSVHRPHTLIGYSRSNVMNMGMTLGAYAAFCRETGRPFAFPGNAQQWNGLTDVTDARLLASHLEWAATSPEAKNQALHIVNGDVFRWSALWGRLAEWFGLESVPFTGQVNRLADQMKGAEATWNQIARRHGLVEPDLARLASFWHTDGDLNRPFECITDMSKSRRLGFADYQTSEQSFLDLFARMHTDRLIP
ncbi:Nucleoside-diphosphate-sugar epimerase [Verrucomicrobium sp. GAS474]|uniref:SDR family oxidoreductase n=1 Tax=Verrucomicrobium sp. GAS474 TaxID=1882831 RepID=UPI00087D40F8|nr:SDR family oxidoreductase [Verrucomicrobium sp. GAS474]SDU29047.1 Nucleoside-diphosphate-sugar epimerase [Verrucomicrobium sp. GAS474]